MKTAPQLETTSLTDSKPARHIQSPSAAVTDFAYQQPGVAKAAATTALTTSKTLPELSTLSALNRQVFGAEAGRELIKEAIAYCSVVAVAGWALTTTLYWLATIEPPVMGPW